MGGDFVRHIYTGLDIGSHAIKIVVCELYKNKLNLLAAVETPSMGIKRGLITDAELAQKSIKKGLDSIEGMLGISIKEVVVSIPSYHADFEVVKGECEIDGNGIIAGKHVQKVLEDALKKER